MHGPIFSKKCVCGAFSGLGSTFQEGALLEVPWAPLQFPFPLLLAHQFHVVCPVAHVPSLFHVPQAIFALYGSPFESRKFMVKLGKFP